ncbi:protein-L-isoaspartate O-methyltransferase family protein [Aliikangiella maris]|uniref:Protein-L-isoaspartate O-methyltransferase n=2 Tax=Aliikangiella maris TaxID=3162458 RepID=A0ABV3MQ39_9GAMM
MNIEKARFNMIEQQIKPWKVFDKKLLGAMATIPREQFVPEEHRNLAYADVAIPLGHNQSMLAPRELARMIQALTLEGQEKVLEIGCGHGYASAILGKLAKHVYSVDIISEFVEFSQQKVGALAVENVTFEEFDATEGWLAHAPYDAILITSAMEKLPDVMKKNLSHTGRIAAILGDHLAQNACLCKLTDNKEWDIEILFPVAAQPMINAERANRFIF